MRCSVPASSNRHSSTLLATSVKIAKFVPIPSYVAPNGYRWPGPTCICTPCHRRFVRPLSQPAGRAARGVGWSGPSGSSSPPTRYRDSRRGEDYALRILMVGPASASLLSALVSLGHTVTEDPADPEGYDVVH